VGLVLLVYVVCNALIEAGVLVHNCSELASGVTTLLNMGS
jgi:hypothetical protein